MLTLGIRPTLVIWEKNSSPSLPEYPKTVFGKERHLFSSDYFKTNNFIEYSKRGDAVFCFVGNISKNRDKTASFAVLRMDFTPFLWTQLVLFSRSSMFFSAMQLV